MKNNLKNAVILISALFVLTAKAPTALAADRPNDISGHWAESQIEYCLDNSYMMSTGNNKFSPKSPVTRAQAVQILYNMNGRPYTSNKTKFEDIANHWAHDAIKWAESLDIISGISPTLFDPDRPVTREQIAVIFYNYERPSENPTDSVLDRFNDHHTVSSWAKHAVAWAVEHQIISGSNNSLRPKDTLSRAELAVIIYNYTQSEQPPNLNTDIEITIKNTDTANFKNYADCCDSTDFERQIMYIITSVKHENLSPNPDWKDKCLINPLWHDPRFVAKITCYELAHANNETTPRIQAHPDPKDYFMSIYGPKNLKPADYVTSYWYTFVRLPANPTPQKAAELLLSDPEFTKNVKQTEMNFYGIYYDIESRWLCIAHGMAQVKS